MEVLYPDIDLSCLFFDIHRQARLGKAKQKPYTSDRNNRRQGGTA